MSCGFRKDILDLMNGSGTDYLLSRDQKRHSVHVQGGLLYQYNGIGLVPLETNSSNSTFIYVMASDGAIYSADKEVVRHHSSFLAGREVAAAGTWTVRQGRPTLITNQSGHYQTPVDYATQILKELSSRGVNTSNISQHWIGGDSAATAKALAATGHQRQRLGDHGATSAKF